MEVSLKMLYTHTHTHTHFRHLGGISYFTSTKMVLTPSEASELFSVFSLFM